MPSARPHARRAARQGWQCQAAAHPRQMCAPAEGGALMLTLGRCQSGQTARVPGRRPRAGGGSARPEDPPRLAVEEAVGNCSPGTWPGPWGPYPSEPREPCPQILTSPLQTTGSTLCQAAPASLIHPTHGHHLLGRLVLCTECIRSFIHSFITQTLIKHLIRKEPTGRPALAGLTAERAGNQHRDVTFRSCIVWWKVARATQPSRTRKGDEDSAGCDVQILRRGDI